MDDDVEFVGATTVKERNEEALANAIRNDDFVDCASTSASETDSEYEIGRAHV